jgi:hypothetical protein
MGEKVFVGWLDHRGRFCLSVINRLEPGSQPQDIEIPHYLGGSFFTDEEFRIDRYEELGDIIWVKMLTCEDLLVVLRRWRGMFGYKVIVSLWDGREETWLIDLDVTTAGLAPVSFKPEAVCLGKNLLAVALAWPQHRLFFWRVNTSQPASTPPQFIGSLTLQPSIPEYDRFLITDLLMNDKFLVVQQRFREGELLVIDLTALFTEDGSAVSGEAQQADPDEPANPWRRIKFMDQDRGDDIDYGYLGLEPGDSARLAVKPRCPSIFKILNLATGDLICQMSIGSKTLPAHWWGGSFHFLKDLQRRMYPDARDQHPADKARLKVVLFDPDSCCADSTTRKKLKKEGFLQSGLSVMCSDAIDHLGPNTFIQFDFYGAIVAENGNLFMASILADTWI